MAFAQIYLTQLRKFCDEEEHAVKAEKLKSNGKIYGEPNSYKMVSQSQIESCLERVQESVWNTYTTHLIRLMSLRWVIFWVRKWVESSRCLFGPKSALGSIESTILGKTHPPLGRQSSLKVERVKLGRKSVFCVSFKIVPLSAEFQTEPLMT